jgi:4-amino-4-deoxy-L-arabinose transferase-like glycosyltransferase
MQSFVPSRAETNHPRREGFRALFVFGAAGFVLWLMAGNLFVLGLDEGIYLEGAVRILHGQAPYRDFFALTGPGSYWLEAAAMKMFGASLASGRLMMLLDIALLTALVYWLAVQLAGRRKLALGSAFIFFAFETGLSFRLYANHRWDSSALALAAVAFAFDGTRRPRRSLFLAAGLSAAAAAWCTPSLLLLLMALFFWILASGELRKYTAPLVAGAAICSLPAVAALAFGHALLPMVHDMLWTAAHYAGPNHVYYGYGSIPHGAGLLGVFAGARGTALLIRLLDLFLAFVPAALPVAVYAVWLLRTRKGVAALGADLRPLLLLMVSSVALLLSAYPRWSADQLMFVAPVFYVLAAYLLDRFMRPRLRASVGLVLLTVALVAFGISTAGLTREPAIRTRVGRIRAVPQDQALIAALESAIPPGSSLFVYPYLPVVYFLTEGANPTSFDFLQPAMMTQENAQAVVQELKAHPPEHVVYFEFPASTFFGIWPHANPERSRFPLIESYLRENYHLEKAVFHPVAEFAILDRNAESQEGKRLASGNR